MKNENTPDTRRRAHASVAALIAVVELLALAGVSSTATSAPAACIMRLRVELTPDVPDPTAPGFLSSLLSNHPGYELTLEGKPLDSVVVVDLTGPGPGYRCRKVLQTMRKDARVVSIRVQGNNS
jgi:hypothetical protein